MHAQFGTYGAWLNPALGDAPASNTRLNSRSWVIRRSGWESAQTPSGDMHLLEQMIAATRHAIIASALTTCCAEAIRGCSWDGVGCAKASADFTSTASGKRREFAAPGATAATNGAGFSQ